MIYENAGIEPPLEELLQDPIFRHLRRYDGLPTGEWPELDGRETVFPRAA